MAAYVTRVQSYSHLSAIRGKGPEPNRGTYSADWALGPASAAELPRSAAHRCCGERTERTDEARCAAPRSRSCVQKMKCRRALGYRRPLGCAAARAAQVEAVGHECDLALLSVEDEFWEESGTEPLALGGIPHLQQSVAVVGYPEGAPPVSSSLWVKAQR